jgi:hypothetical protein
MLDTQRQAPIARVQVAGMRIGRRFRIAAGQLEIDGAIIGVARCQVAVCQPPEA